MTRQMKRAESRAAAKIDRAHNVRLERHNRQRDRLERQSRRELEGFYEGTPSVASRIAPSRSRINSRKVQKGQAFGRIIRKAFGWHLHATKGWRVA